MPKPKTYNKYNFISGEEEPYTDYGDYNNKLDADGNPSSMKMEILWNTPRKPWRV